MTSSSHYASRYPHPALRPWVDRIGVQHHPGFDPAAAPTRIVPTGTADLVFHYGDDFEAVLDDRVTPEPRAYVTAQRQTPISARATGSTGVVVVSLQPWGAPAILGLPATALPERTTALDAFLPAQPLRDLLDALAEMPDCETRLRRVEIFLLDRMVPSLDGVARAAAEEIAADPGGVRVSGLAAQFGMSRRHFDRRFAAAIGLAPKPFARVQRFQQALGRLKAGAGLAEVACGAGYHDQSHMHREFVALAGRTPAVLRAGLGATPLQQHYNRDGVSRFYNTVYLA